MTNKLKHIVRDGVDHSKTHMEGQIKANRHLVFEPPWNVWSWKLPVIDEVVSHGTSSDYRGTRVCLDTADCGHGGTSEVDEDAVTHRRRRVASLIKRK